MKTRKILSYCFLFREKLCINYCHILENPTCFYNFKNSCFCVKTNVLTMTLYCVLNCNQNTLHVKVHGPVRNIIMIITHGLQCQCAMAICRSLTTSKINRNFNKHSIVTDEKKMIRQMWIRSNLWEIYALQWTHSMVFIHIQQISIGSMA